MQNASSPPSNTISPSSIYESNFLASCIEPGPHSPFFPTELLMLRKQLSRPHQPLRITLHTPVTALSLTTTWKAACIFLLTFQKSLSVSFKYLRTLKPYVYKFLLAKEWHSLFRTKFYCDVLLLFSCGVSSNKCTKHKGGKRTRLSSSLLTPLHVSEIIFCSSFREPPNRK